MKEKLKISAIFAAILLVGIAFVPAVSSQAESVSSSSADKEKIEVTKLPEMELKIININDTSNIVQVGDTLITFESNPEHTEAEMQIENLTTNEVTNIIYKVSEIDGKFKTDVYQEGELVNTVTSVYNPIVPGSMKEILGGSSAKQGTETVNAITSTKYTWDGVHFVKGSGIKYPHPDYDSYTGEIFDTWYISGTKLKHYHIEDSYSDAIADCAPAVAGATIGLIVGGGIGAIVGAGLGALLGGPTSSILLDEEGCIWGWCAHNWGWRLGLPPNPLTSKYVPDYYRVASYTLWNFIGLSNP